MAQSLDLTNLPEYINQLSDEIQTSIFAESKYLKSGVTFKEGIKHKDLIHQMWVKPVMKLNTPGSTFSSEEDQVGLDNRIIEVTPVKIEMSFDERTINETWLGQYADKGSYNEDMPTLFKTAFALQMSQSLEQEIENILISGNSGLTASTNLNMFDGILTVAGADPDVVDVTGTTLTANNIITEFDKLLAAMPQNIYTQNDLTIYCSLPTFRMLTVALRTANLYHYEVNEIGLGFLYPQTNVFIQPIAAMPNNKLFLTHSKNIMVGVDAKNDPTNFQSEYDFNSDSIRLRWKFKMGTQIIRPEEFVLYA